MLVSGVFGFFVIYVLVLCKIVCRLWVFFSILLVNVIILLLVEKLVWIYCVFVLISLLMVG